MPLVKRNIEPRHLCRGALPDGVTSELECVTNSTLAAIIKQLGSLSRHAEDIFGELFNEANSFYLRMNSLQERVDLLVIKVTQLDSTVEEVSLQDINMRKAFKSSTIQNQQVVSRNSIPNPVMEMYQRCDKPPPLNILTPYRDDKKDGLKFYTDPSYFFNLWKEKMLQATEDKRKEKRRQKEQRLVEDSTREVKKVRKARNRRLEWNMMAYDKEFRPDNRFSPSPYHMASSEGSLSPDNRSYASDVADHSYPASPNHPGQQMMAPTSHLAAENKEVVLVATQIQDQIFRPSAVGSRQNSLNRVQQPHVPQPSETMLNGPRPQIIKDYGPQPVPMADYFVPPAPPPPPPVIPSAQTAFDSPISAPSAMAPNAALSISHATYVPTPPPAVPCPYSASPPQAGPMGPPVAPPPPPPGPPTISASPAHTASPPALTVETRKPPVPLIPMTDARSDLLAAIRRGIQLRKVQEQWEQEAKKEPVGNDVATILSRRIAVEYSESDDDSELDENEWSD
ncbi:wiskott-Aldrich syndrome protein family member 3-like [Protobothrops mucrosquamatus]|uniref:wiskott-Aldrich syndrome protein family member 3-like n=1 Tax=Protobothrops mucrosquamatus TaxID=103944 RepID=UPI0010FB6AEC|nr:wiskott-Aldrich syndrome protein family member 3-like [Protobothrops mucrosquamatus]